MGTDTGTTGNEVPSREAFLARSSEICLALMRMAGHTRLEFADDPEMVEYTIKNHVTRWRRPHYTIHPVDDGKGCSVLYTGPDRRPRGGVMVGRPVEPLSLRQRLMGMKRGETIILRDIKPASVRVQASKLKADSGAAFRLQFSEGPPFHARVTRIDGLHVTDGYGKTIALTDIHDKTDIPFRYVTPGARMGLREDEYDTIEELRSLCRIYSGKTGYLFVLERDGRDLSVVITCTYRLSARTTPEQREREARRLREEPIRWVGPGF